MTPAAIVAQQVKLAGNPVGGSLVHGDRSGGLIEGVELHFAGLRRDGSVLHVSALRKSHDITIID